jgi:hypothetical protein
MPETLKLASMCLFIRTWGSQAGTRSGVLGSFCSFQGQLAMTNKRRCGNQPCAPYTLKHSSMACYRKATFCRKDRSKRTTRAKFSVALKGTDPDQLLVHPLIHLRTPCQCTRHAASRISCITVVSTLRLPAYTATNHIYLGNTRPPLYFKNDASLTVHQSQTCE